MKNSLRMIAGITALAAGALLVRHISRERQARAEWQREFPANEVSRFPPLVASVGDLCRAPPPPGRRVILSGPIVVRDTIFTERPILRLDRVQSQPEGIIFLADSITGERLIVLRRLDVRGPEWIELTPTPLDVRLQGSVRRWTPLVHLKDIWMPGWAEANGPARFVWLGLDSAVTRYRDLAGPSDEPPYRLCAEPIAGRPGGPPEPEMLSLWTLLWAGIVVVLGSIALIGGIRLHQRP